MRGVIERAGSDDPQHTISPYTTPTITEPTHTIFGEVHLTMWVGQQHEVVLSAVPLDERWAFAGVHVTSLRRHQSPHRSYRILGRGMPVDAIVTPKPGTLSSYEPPGEFRRFRGGGGHVTLAVQFGQHLLVPERPTRRRPLAQSAVFQPTYLVHEPRIEHARNSTIHAVIQFGVGPVEANQHRPVPRISRSGQISGERLSGDLDDFQSSDDPSTIARQNRARRIRIALPQQPMELIRPNLGQLAFPTGANLPIGAGKGQIVNDRLDIQPGTASEHRGQPTTSDVVHQCSGLPLVSSYRGWFSDVQYIQQVVRDAVSLRPRELGRADIHPAVKLHRIGIDHFTAEFHGKPDGQL